MVANTGCDAVMIGRTAPSNPWIFRQIAQYKASLSTTGVGTYEHPTEQDRYQMMRKYFEMLIAEDVPGAGGKMKQFASWFTHGVPGGAILRKAIYEARGERAIIDCVDAFFAARQCGTLIDGDGSSADATLEAMPMAECG
jgi:tRNA-dihydrouridine synthase B